MALNFDELSASTFKNYRRTFSDNIMKKIALYSHLRKKGGIERKRGGLKLVEPLLYGFNNTFKSYSGYDVLNTSPQEGLTAAEYDWKNLAVSITISKEEEDVNSGESRIINLLKSKIAQAEKTYTMKFNEMLFGTGSGNGGKDVSGLKTYITATPAVGTIGGINAADYDWWRNQYANPATFVTGGLGLSNMRSMKNLCSREGDSPKIIITSRDTFEAYEGILTTIERINFTKGQALAGDAGFEELTFAGLPMLWDYHATSKDMFFLNTDYLKLVIDTQNDFEMTEWRQPINQMARTCFIIFRGQLTCNNRLLQGLLQFQALT